LSLSVNFDVSQTGRTKAGCGFYAHALASVMPSLAPDMYFNFHPDFGDFYYDLAMPLGSPFPAPNSSYGPRHLVRSGAAAFWNGPDLERRLGTPDILHANNFWCPARLAATRLVYTLYDMAFAFEPEWTTEENRIGCFNGVFRASITADWIVAISQSSMLHFLEVFPHFPSERIRVIHPCSRFTDDSLEGSCPDAVRGLVPGEYWLSVGTIEPRKNQRMLLQAFKEYISAGGRPMPLVLAGGEGWRMQGFPEEVRDAGLGSLVRLTGYVRDDELVWLYRNCYANVYPSLFEGFGLPLLEGMQFGAASIASSNSSLPEVAGDDAILLDPHDRAAWTEAMLMLSSDPSRMKELRQRARLRSACFDWRRSACALLDLYREAAASPKRSVPCAVR
jgi:glycosyltransferase involved in cell wall biosynthesis